MNKKITITQPDNVDNGFTYMYNINGVQGTCYLTYNLLGNLDKRTLLVTSEDGFLQNSKNLENFEILKQKMFYYAKTRGSFEVTKTVVNDIYINNVTIPNTGIAVHKYGPVPVFIFPEPIEIIFNGNKRKCNIAILPKVQGIKLANQIPIGTQSDIEYLNSLKIRLDIVFKKYLEDVGELLFDIENHSNITIAVKKAKKAMTVLKLSISSKINKIESNAKGIDNHLFRETRRIKNELLGMYSESIFKAKYASYFAMYFIEEMYNLLGFIKKNDFDLIDKFNDHDDYFQKLNSDLDVTLLEECFSYFRYDEGGKIKSTHLSNKTDNLWVKRFIDFSNFIYHLKEFKNSKSLDTHTPKIFLSYQYKSDSSNIVKNQIKDLIISFFKGKVELLDVKEDQAGTSYKDMIKSGIWLSNSTYTPLSEKTSISNEKYNWLAKESIHSESLRNDLIYILNEKTGNKILEHFKEVLINMNDYLTPNSRTLKQNKKNVLLKLNEQVHVKFDAETVTRLDENMKKQLKDNIEKLIYSKVIQIINMWLNQFDRKVVNYIIKTNKEIHHPTKMTQMARIVLGSNSKKSVTYFRNRIWNEVRKRKITINGVEYSLIKQIGKTSGAKYTNNISNILKALLDESDEVIEKLTNRCFKL